MNDVNNNERDIYRLFVYDEWPKQRKKETGKNKP